MTMGSKNSHLCLLMTSLQLCSSTCSSIRQMCAQCPRLPLSMFAPLFSSFHSAHPLSASSIKQTLLGDTPLALLLFPLSSFPSVTNETSWTETFSDRMQVQVERGGRKQTYGRIPAGDKGDRTCKGCMCV